MMTEIVIKFGIWAYHCEKCGLWFETSEEMRDHYQKVHFYSPVNATLVTRTSYECYEHEEVE